MLERDDASDEADDLLVYGKAAVVANSAGEARFYLEWALRANPSVEQEAEAYYWLSRVATDPAERRNYLENVLAACPTYPEARRDLAILDGRLDPAEILDPMQTVQPVAPSSTVPGEDVKRFTCPKCGGRMAFRPEKQGLYCQFCGYTERGAAPAALVSQTLTPVANDGNGSGVREQDWVAAIYTVRGHSWVLPSSRTLTCQGCGANVTMLPSQVSGTCPFCGSPQVVTEECRELIEPNGMAPFALDGNTALANARRWLEESRFRPGDLDELAALSAPRPVYLPCWTFDMDGEVRWSGVVVQREYKQVSYVQTSGSIPVMCDDILVPASNSLPSDSLRKLHFDSEHLVPYSPGMLANWPAEIYSLALADASLLARDYVLDQTRGSLKDKMSISVPDAVDDVRLEGTDLSVASYKLVLLPVWVTEYTYKGERYRVLVNGQTGSVEGDLPRTGLMKLVGELFDR